MNIYEKLNEIINELGPVEKNLYVPTGKSSYKAVSEKDVLDAIKPIEYKYKIYSYPVSREVIDDEQLEKISTSNNKETKTISQFMRIKTTYRFVNIEKPEEFIDIVSYGDGIDTGDKAPGKAMTYSDKYALMKGYKVSTGDDPDKDASENYNNAQKRKELNTGVSTMQNTKKLVTKHIIDLFNKWVETNKIDKKIVEQILSKYGFKSINEVDIDNYKKIVNELNNILKKEEIA